LLKTFFIFIAINIPKKHGRIISNQTYQYK